MVATKFRPLLCGFPETISPSFCRRAERTRYILQGSTTVRSADPTGPKWTLHGLANLIQAKQTLDRPPTDMFRVHAKGVVLCERTCFCLLSTF